MSSIIQTLFLTHISNYLGNFIPFPFYHHRQSDYSKENQDKNQLVRCAKVDWICKHFLKEMQYNIVMNTHSVWIYLYTFKDSPMSCYITCKTNKKFAYIFEQQISVRRNWKYVAADVRGSVFHSSFVLRQHTRFVPAWGVWCFVVVSYNLWIARI